MRRNPPGNCNPASGAYDRFRGPFHPTRSPDVYLVPQPFAIDGSGPGSHGSPYGYDSNVPLVFYGAGLTPQEVVRPVDVMDIAPTFSALLRTAYPSAAAGMPLPEVTGGVKLPPLASWKRKAF